MRVEMIPIGHEFVVNLKVRSDKAVIYCPDPRLRMAHKYLIRLGLKLGRRNEEYVPFPILGGAAVLAHPEQFSADLVSIRTFLETMRDHFGVRSVALIGHENCLHMGQYHASNETVVLGRDPIYEDMITVRRMYDERSISSDCPVRKMFFDLNMGVDVIYMKFPTSNKLEYIVIE